MNKWLNKLKVKAILPAAALIAAAAIGTTFAWQQWDLSVENQLKAHDTKVVVNEEFNNEVKENVSFTNNGSSSVFLRVAYSEYWEKNGLILSNVDEDGNSIAQKEWSDAWTEGDACAWTHCTDGWSYYNRSLRAGESTGTILKKASANSENLPAEYEGAQYHLYFKAEVVQCSDGSNTLNCDKVNEDAIKEVFAKNVTVGGKDVHKDGSYNLNWSESDGRYIGGWPAN